MFSVNGPGFLLFLAVLVPVWYRTPAARRWTVMLAASAVFYLALDVPGFFVLLAAAWAVWQCAKRAPSRLWFRLGLAAALAPLLLKYCRPLADWMSAVLGVRLWAGQGLLIPLGLSYFTLQLAGYLIDVQTKRIAPEPRFARVLCYALFFLSITQGPFNRYDDLMPQLDSAPAYSGARVWRGAQRMAWGYFKKLAVAERCAIVVGDAFADPALCDTSQLLFAVVMFAVQMYADFSGYTDIVLGAGEALGLTLPENFRQPYFAGSISEFWDRWHISLTGWLNSYIFNPLALKLRRAVAKWPKERRKRYKQLPVCTAVVVTFLVSGLWHGTGLQFLAWGLLHGTYQVAGALTAKQRKRLWERLGVPEQNPLRRAWRVVFVFLLVNIGYVFFRAESLTAALQYFACMARNPGTKVFSNYWELGLSSRMELLLLLLGSALVAAVDALRERGVRLRDRLAAAPIPVRWAAYYLALFAFLLMGRFLATGGFLYARF